MYIFKNPIKNEECQPNQTREMLSTASSESDLLSGIGTSSTHSLEDTIGLPCTILRQLMLRIRERAWFCDAL